MGRSHKDRVAVITGAAGGLGQAFALRMAEEGCHVALTDIRSCKEISTKVEALGRDVYHEKCDLAVPDDIQKFADNVLSRFGTVDILVNNAAYMHLCNLEEIDLETFQMYEKVNLDAPMLLCRAFVQGMAKQRYGRIVNMTSSTAWGPQPGFLGYITTKMGIIGMTRYLAVELGQKGITVNALSPSLTRHAGNENTFSAEFFEMISQRQAIKRTQVPEDIVGTLVFLTSDDAAFLTGQTIATCGGKIFL